MSMTYTKLFSSITESTVWCEPAGTRLVWITFLAKADRLGRVFASVPGLANLARVSLDECVAALETFTKPDPWSRTPDHDGRRIEAIEGGWRLLNYEKYREMRDEEARRAQNRDAKRRQRQRETGEADAGDGEPVLPAGSEAAPHDVSKGADSQHVDDGGDGRASSPVSNCADSQPSANEKAPPSAVVLTEIGRDDAATPPGASADVSKQADSQPRSASPPGRSANSSAQAEAEAKKEQKQKQKHVRGKPRGAPLPDGFGVSERVKGWAAEKGYDRLDAHLEAFQRKAQAHGYRYVDWDAAFMEAIREDWAKLRSGTTAAPAAAATAPRQRVDL